MSFIAELKRRNVFKVAAAYVVVSWLVMQITDTVGDLMGTPDMVGKVIVLLLMAGFPVALFLAWAYELTPEGVKKEKDVDKAESITHVTGRKIDIIIIVLLVIAAGYFFWESRYSDHRHSEAETAEVSQDDSANSSGKATIAVLPFIDLSEDRNQEYFTDGLSEELLNVLAHIPDLKVAARTSSFYFKGKNLPIIEVAETLGVAHVLEGSVRKAGDKIRITAQLIRAADGFHLWSGTFDRKLDDVFVIQDEISRAIVDALQVKMGLGEQKSNPIASAIQKTSPEAHNSYLLGKELLRKRNEASIMDAITQFEQALKIDPDYAPAMARQAEAWLLLRRSPDTFGSLSEKEVTEKVQPLLQKALSLSPELAEANAVQGMFFNTRRMPDEALNSLQKALRINPNLTEASNWLGNLLNNMGRIREAMELFRETYDKDPLSIPILGNLLLRKSDLNEWDNFPELLAKLKTLEPDIAAEVSALYQQRRQNYADAVHAGLQSGNLDNKRILSYLIFDMARIGLTDSMDPVVENSASYMPRVWQYMVKRQYPETVSLLEKRMLEQHEDQRQQLAAILSQDQQWQKANALFERLWNEQKDNGLPLGGIYHWQFLEFIYSRKHVQGLEAAQPLLLEWENVIRLLEDQGFDRTEIKLMKVHTQLVLDEHEKALDLLEPVVTEGWLETWLFDYPAINVLKDNPRYQTIVTTARETQQKHRHKFLQSVCADNPYKAYWQPGEENCKEVQP